MSIKKLKDFVELPNIASELSEEDLREIGQRILAGFDEDHSSMQDWLQDVKKVMDLASLKASKKSYPLPDSANIKFPIITKAAYEFSSRTYPEIIKDGRVVKTRVIGKDFTGEKAKQAQRVEDYMNYQLMFENGDWEAELDKLLTLLALIGFVCQKTYYDPVRQKIKTQICEYDSLIINAKAKSLEDAERISHIMKLSLNEAIENVRSELYLEEPIQKILDRVSENDLRPMVEIIEQHCFLDLDEDGYAEPYIVTILKDCGEVLRIFPRFTEEDIKEKKGKVQYINAIQYFTDYHFLVSPKGHFQGVGFGILMLHLNASINTILNQIVDAGQLSNLQGGYIDARAKVIESGQSLHDPGELKKVKTTAGLTVKDSVHMFNFKEPSSVLYQTLGLLIDTARDLSSTTDVLSGSSGTNNVKTGAVLALQEAGMKVMTAIQKRVYRSLCNHYNKLFKLNQLYLDPSVYVQVLDDDLAVQQQDFDPASVNVIPVADPNLSSESSRALKAQFLAGIISFPGVKPEEITKRILTSTNIENPEQLLLSDEEMQQMKQAPNPEVIKVQAEISEKAEYVKLEARKIELAEKQLMLDAAKTEVELIKMKTEALLNVAKAEAAEAGNQLNEYSQQLDIVQTHIQNMLQERQMSQDMMRHQDEMAMRQQEAQANAQQNSGMAGPSSNEGSA